MTGRELPRDFRVLELRRYAIRDGGQSAFTRYFDTLFPEAFQQIGAIAVGQFLERGNGNSFTWIRGFKDVDARATGNAAFYFGPVWKEHASTLNGLMTDSDNVLLLQPLRPERGVVVLPAVDPAVEESGARGVVVAQIFAVEANRVEDFAALAEPAFARYRAAGVYEAGVLTTLDVPNNFPRLPFRTDGPYVVWLGIVKDDAMLERRFRPIAEDAMPALAASGLLRSAPETVVLDPTPRSRLRWLREWEG